jgi:hypothetical protein
MRRSCEATACAALVVDDLMQDQRLAAINYRGLNSGRTTKTQVAIASTSTSTSTASLSTSTIESQESHQGDLLRLRCGRRRGAVGGGVFLVNGGEAVHALSPGSRQAGPSVFRVLIRLPWGWCAFSAW